MFSREQKDELEKRLNPERIKKRQGKDYIEGHFAIRTANEVFGFDGWSWRIIKMNVSNPIEVNKRDGDKQAYCNAVCHGEIVIGDAEIIRHGIGAGSGYGPTAAPGDAAESAAKEAETDALKRALRGFGDRFGLELYDKSMPPEEASKELYGEPSPAESGQEGRGFFAFLDFCGKEKSRIGEVAYYQVLSEMGFKKSNQVPKDDRELQGKIGLALKDQPDNPLMQWDQACDFYQSRFTSTNYYVQGLSIVDKGYTVASQVLPECRTAIMIAWAELLAESEEKP